MCTYQLFRDISPPMESTSFPLALFSVSLVLHVRHGEKDLFEHNVGERARYLSCSHPDFSPRPGRSILPALTDKREILRSESGKWLYEGERSFT